MIEQTINRDRKGPGGIIDPSTSQGSMQRWVHSSHNSATLTADFKRGIRLDSRKGSKYLSHERILDDESDPVTAYSVYFKSSSAAVRTGYSSSAQCVLQLMILFILRDCCLS